MLFQLDEFLSDPKSMIISLLLMLPGILLSLSIHESAHGLVAEWCGDPTARLMGRITLNPVKHFDLMGFLCILFVGFGWAKPVPVNPLQFRNWRRDDLKVSLAGITANLMLMLICFLILSFMFTGALAKLPSYDLDVEVAQLPYYSMIDYRKLPKEEQPEFFRTNIALSGECIATPDGYIEMDKLNVYGRPVLEMLRPETENSTYLLTCGGKTNVELPDYYYIDGESLFSGFYYWYEEIISPAFGPIAAILYRMVLYCMIINLSLAVFNLLPIPPLDGYHVFNDIILKRDLFASRRTMQMTSGILIALVMIGNIKPEWDILSIVIDFVIENVTDGLSHVTRLIASAVGVI